MVGIRKRGHRATILLTVGIFAFGATAWSVALLPAAYAAPANVCDWNDMDWGEMTKADQAAWMTLGWNKRLWDSGGDSASSDKDWSELSPQEQAAARALGYSQQTWDKGSC